MPYRSFHAFGTYAVFFADRRIQFFGYAFTQYRMIEVAHRYRVLEIFVAREIAFEPLFGQKFGQIQIDHHGQFLIVHHAGDFLDDRGRIVREWQFEIKRHRSACVYGQSSGFQRGKVIFRFGIGEKFFISLFVYDQRRVVLLFGDISDIGKTVESGKRILLADRSLDIRNCRRVLFYYREFCH